ncbi:EthD domain-containing protein [Streptomyces sp. NPDC059627]|uniref:EthD domain-containing protein n=1 Tax=Streptomyces sp. NPDC001980 TaxID=3157126 RepID=UPI00332C5E38
MNVTARGIPAMGSAGPLPISRLDKLVAAVRRRPGMTHAEQADYIRTVHRGIALANKLTMVKYVQNHVYDRAYGAIGYQVPLPRDSVTELYFEKLETMAYIFAEPYTRDVTGPDGVNFSDLLAALSVLVEEKQTQVPLLGAGLPRFPHHGGGVPSAVRATASRPICPGGEWWASQIWFSPPSTYQLAPRT